MFRFIAKNYPALLMVILMSFICLVRYQYEYFHNLTGFIISDILYIYQNYSLAIERAWVFPIEYPVGYIIIAKIANMLGSIFIYNPNWTRFFIGHALLILLSAFLIFKYSTKMAQLIGSNQKITMMYLLLSPSFYVMSTQNYDVFVTCLTVIAIYLTIKNHFTGAAILLAIGVVIKVYPIFLVPIISLYIYQQHRSDLFKTWAVFIIFWLYLNLPFSFLNFDYWLTPYLWQLNNPYQVTPNTISYYIRYFWGSPWHRLLFVSLILESWTIAFYLYKQKKFSSYALIMTSTLCLSGTILGSNVFSPQYILWVIPLLAILQPKWLWIFWPLDFFNAVNLAFAYHPFWSKLTVYYHAANIATPLLVWIALHYQIYRYVRSKKS